MRLFLIVAGVVCAVASAGSGADGPTTLPNIVIIFMDDMGYADIGSFGAEGYKTPNLDRLALEGRRFTNFYASQPVCSASRASLMTGCYNVRIGILGALGPRADHGISQSEMTLAEVCKQKGYATACFGKWHLGHHPKFLPPQHGFDEYFGLPYSNDMWPFHPGVVDLPMEERFKSWPHLPLIDGTSIVRPKMTDDEQNMLTTWYNRACRQVHRQEQGPAVLSLRASLHGPCAAARLRQVRRQVAARSVRRCDDGGGLVGGRDRRGHPPERHRETHHGHLHVRQRPVVELRRACRLGQAPAGRQRHNLRRRLP